MECILFNEVTSAILPNNYCFFCSSPHPGMLPSLKTNTKKPSQKTQTKTVQCLMISRGCDAFSVAGGCRQHHNSCGDCTRISIADWTPPHVWEHPSFPCWALVELGVSYAIGVSDRGKSSFKVECLQVGQVWNFFSPYANLTDYCCFGLSLLEH